MSDHPVDPLPPDVVAALDGERARPPLDAATRARVRERLQASLLAGGSGGQGSGAPEQEPSVSRASRMSPWAAARAHPLATALIGFAVGVGTGMAIEAHFVAHTSVPAPPQAIAPAPTTAVTHPASAPSAPPIAEEPPPSVPTAAPPVVSSASTLTAERALLDVAHAALGNGQATEALSALNRHAQRFAHGVYREEREALTIQCLRALGRTTEAERRTATFRTRYPNSLFLSTIEHAQDTKGADR